MRERRTIPESRPCKRLTLEQKIRRLARQHRARERRAERSKVSRGHCRSSTMCWMAFVASLALIASVVASTDSATATSFEQANQDYAAGHFAEAARGFEHVIARQGFSAPVLFNLGNAWLKAGQPGKAILNYERARLLAPGDEAVAANLQLARERANIVAPKPNFVERAARSLGWNALSFTGATVLVMICILVMAGRLNPRIPKSILRGAIVCSALVFLTAAASLAIRWPDLNEAVVLATDTPARIAPADAAGVSFKLPAGELVQARKNHNGFVLIRTPSGQSGWVSKAQVAKVMASADEREQEAATPVAANGKS